MKKILLLGGLMAALVPASASAAQNFGACALDGAAKLTPGLTANTPTPTPTVPGGFEFPQEVNWGPAFKYSFHGSLSQCTGASSAGPVTNLTGNISAGENVTINGKQYLPFNMPSGNGGCSGSHTDGVSVITWSDGKLSAVDYSTDGAAALVTLTGSFMSSITLTRVDKGPNGETLTDTFTGLAYAGDYTGGPLAFHPADPTQCNGAGVTDAPITGTIAHGNYA